MNIDPKCHGYHSGRWTENNKKILGEHKVITPKQQFPGIILCFFYEFKMAVPIAFLCKNAVEAI